MADKMKTEEDEARLEAGRLLFAKQCDFIMGAVKPDGFPPGDLPEIAFAGRSNVGKSSLINALTGRKTLARTSNTPGRTQEINFFRLDNRLSIADLPGYGYAKVSKSQVKDWTHLVKTYLRGRPILRRACLLIDARHGIKPNDDEIAQMLDAAAVSYQFVLTKADKISKAELAAVTTDTEAKAKKHPAAFPAVFVTSAEKGWGIAELRGELASLAEW